MREIAGGTVEYVLSDQYVERVLSFLMPDTEGTGLFAPNADVRAQCLPKHDATNTQDSDYIPFEQWVLLHAKSVYDQQVDSNRPKSLAKITDELLKSTTFSPRKSTPGKFTVLTSNEHTQFCIRHKLFS